MSATAFPPDDRPPEDRPPGDTPPGGRAPDDLPPAGRRRPEETPPDDLPPEAWLDVLPLFPLNLVLFPGMALPLHIFEERYKAMIGDCLRRDAPFGVALIRSGPEVGAPAEPHRTGTTARVLRSQLLEEGRMNIMTKGERRFEIVQVTQQIPHLEARVRYLDEPVGERFAGVSPELADEYYRLVRNLAALTGGYASQVELPSDPVALSYGIAGSLELPAPLRQELLEAPTADDRLTRLLPLLRRSNHALQEEIARRNPFKGPRLN